MSGNENAHAPRWLLALSAIVTGALVMVLEILGSRVIGPFFGVSLFVWTSLIAVTLIALAAGYAIGGVLVDRYASPDLLYALIAAAGLLSSAIVHLKDPVLEATLGLGLRAGAFISTLVLFGPPLLALGCASPFFVRLAVRDVSHVGRTVGGFYALSTAGSVLGTVLTGFALIGWLGVTGTLTLVAGLSLGLAALYFAAVRRRWWALLLLLLAAPAITSPPRTPVQTSLADGTTVRLLAAHHGHYGSLKVLEYRHGGLRNRELVIDGLVQGGIDPANGLSVYAYPYVLTTLARGLHPAGSDALVIGLGAGVVPRLLEQAGVRTHSVDIDPAVARMAREHFGFRPGGTVHVADARHFLRRDERRYDYLVLDVFTGDTTPAHLMSLEAAQSMAARLTPRGVLAVNAVGAVHGPQAYMTASVVRTLEQVFDTVEVVPMFEPSAAAPSGNLALLAYQGPVRAPHPGKHGVGPVHRLAADTVTGSLARRWRFPPQARAIVLTDDYNPVEFFDARLRESVRETILRSTPHALLRNDG